MTTEQLTGLKLAVKLLAQIGDEQSDAAIAAVHDLADEHAQRVTMQHHAADMAQRIAELEAERDSLQHAYHRQREDAQARVDAAVLRALTAERERDELRARLDAAEKRAVSAMTREDAALLCEEVSSDLIAAMMRQGASQADANSMTAAARLCASELRSGYSAAPEAAR